MENVITDENIRNFVSDYIDNRSLLPGWLQGISISDWDVSHVTDMSELFEDYEDFNEPLDGWNVSNVTNMDGMFRGCRNFNQNLGNWNVSNVENMRTMFFDCISFNQPLNLWDVSNVIDMEAMFFDCTRFNQPLNLWHVSSVTNMSCMFQGCNRFNKPLSNWDVSNVENMSHMFFHCMNFNQNLGNWNVSNVEDMSYMFFGCARFNQDLSDWDISGVIDIRSMFENCTIFNINPNWRFNQETDTENIFFGSPLEDEEEEIQVQPQVLPPPLPQGLAYEIHNAFVDLDLQKFMTIIRRENNGTSNFKDSNNVLQPVVSYINGPDTALSPEQKTRYVHNITDSIYQNVNAFIAGHPEVKDDTLEVIQFVLSQDQNYKDLYIETFENECMGGYSSGNRQSCIKGMFERIYMANKGTIEGLCFDKLQVSTTASSAPDSISCKPIYLELYSAFTPGSDIDINDIFQKWYNQFSYDAVPEEENPLKNLSVDARKQHFRDFVRQDQAITPRIWMNREFQNKLEKSIEMNKNIFKTLDAAAIGGRRRTRKNKKNMLKHKQRKTMKKQRHITMKHLKRKSIKRKRTTKAR